MNRLFSMRAVCGFLLISGFSLAHAQFDSTKSGKTVKAVAPQVQAVATPLSPGDVSFDSFIKRYEGKTFSGVTTPLGTQLFTWAPIWTNKKTNDGFHYLSGLQVEFEPGRLCVTSTHVPYTHQRRACIDGNGNVFNVQRWYGAWKKGCSMPDDTLIADRCANIDGYKETERINWSADGLVVYLPSWNGSLEPLWNAGQCLRIRRSDLDKGVAGTFSPCSSAS